MYKKIILIGCLIFSTLTFAKEMTIKIKDGSLTLGDLIKSCQEIAESKSSKFVPSHIPGKRITVDGQPYEVRYFSFEDTTGKMPNTTTFKDYVQKTNLSEMKSVSSTPLPGIEFESFDFRRKRKDAPVNDGVYFSMAVRKIENGDNKMLSPQG